jgi:hypothetical protein
LIPESLALVDALQNLILAAVIGGALGLVVSLALRLRWSWKRIGADMFIAVLSTLGLVLMVIWYDSRFRTSHDHSWTFVLGGASVPALWHVFTYVARSPE